MGMAQTATPLREEVNSRIFDTTNKPLSAEITREVLIDLIRQKDEKGFSLLYDNYSHALFGVICRIVTDTNTAEDILQESFVKIWRNIDQYEECKGTFFTWMLNITRNNSIDYLRSKQHSQKQRNKPETDLNKSVNGTVVAANIDHIGLRNTVSKLDAPYCDVINLLYFGGYTQEEVAQTMDIPLGTVKTRARRALQLLRNKF